MVEKKKLPLHCTRLFPFDSSPDPGYFTTVTILMGFSVSIGRLHHVKRRRRCPVIDDALLIILAVDWPPANPIFINLNADALKIQFQTKESQVYRRATLPFVWNDAAVSKNTP